MRRRLGLLVFGMCLLLAVPPGSATAFSFFDTGIVGGSPSGSLLGVAVSGSDVGSSFSVDWNVAVGADQLGATATYQVVSLSASQLTLGISITNTTLLSPTLTNADILSMGFGISPNATASFVTAGGVFDGIGAGSGPNQTFPGGFKGVDVCVFGQGCSGGAVAQGLHAGATDAFTLTIAGDFAGGTLDLLYFPVKFQTSRGSYEPGGALIPEPSAALLFGIGLLLARVPLRRRG